jgi:hypothetical protein
LHYKNKNKLSTFNGSILFFSPNSEGTSQDKEKVNIIVRNAYLKNKPGSGARSGAKIKRGSGSGK